MRAGWIAASESTDGQLLPRLPFFTISSLRAPYFALSARGIARGHARPVTRSRPPAALARLTSPLSFYALSPHAPARGRLPCTTAALQSLTAC